MLLHYSQELFYRDTLEFVEKILSVTLSAIL